MVLFASNLMDMGDYLRCAYYLRKIYKINGVFSLLHSHLLTYSLTHLLTYSLTHSGVFQMKSSIGMFLGTYSLFLAGEKSKEQDSCEVVMHLLNNF